MRRTYKRILMFIGILILGCIFIGIAYLFYDKVINTGTDVEVIGELSVNYFDGTKIEGNNTYNFSITNNGSNDIYYEILIDNLKNYESKVKYSLLSSEASINIENNNIEINTNNLASNILIPMGTTQNFQLKLKNNKMTSFNLIIKKTVDSKEYFYATILKNNNIKDNSLTLVGKDISKDNEGLIEDYDATGTVYYFRGNVDNNYVSFADNTWRIVKINSDGTVKMVLDDVISELSSYNDEATGFEDFNNTSVSDTLKVYYETYLQEYDEYIAGNKYCLDSLSTGEENNKTYNAYNRLVTDKTPNFNCLGTTYTSKIGLLTADEVMYAGATTDSDNKNFYLYNSEIENVWWTSTLAKATDTDFNPFAISVEGKIISDISGTLFRGIRPTINLDRKTIVNGDGTKDNPYVVNIS